MEKEPKAASQIPNPDRRDLRDGFAEILREQAQVNVLLPAGSRRYKNWRDVPESLHGSHQYPKTS